MEISQSFARFDNPTPISLVITGRGLLDSTNMELQLETAVVEKTLNHAVRAGCEIAMAMKKPSRFVF